MEDESVMEVKSPDGASDQIAHLKQVTKDGPVYLSGILKYHYYAVKEGETLPSWDNLISNAMLEFLEGQNIQLSIMEIQPDGSERPSVMNGKMTPSGQIQFSLPAPLPIGLYITDIIQMHTGCELFGGDGINKGTLIYNGYFDGERLIATAQFHLKCEVEWPANDIFPTPVDGPVQGKWTIDVTMD
jgi:hypothetical protein